MRQSLHTLTSIIPSLTFQPYIVSLIDKLEAHKVLKENDYFKLNCVTPNTFIVT